MFSIFAAIHIRRTRRKGPGDETLDTVYLSAAMFCDALLETLAIMHILE